MEYCRKLKFEDTPDYSVCVGFWEKCMARHELNNKIFDYTWKQNRLSKEKEILKASLMTLINKPTKKNKKGDDDAGNT